MRWTVAVLLVAAVSLGCGAGGSGVRCGPANCTGCCGPDGMCVFQATNANCGIQGGACNACSAGESCTNGICGGSVKVSVTNDYAVSLFSVSAVVEGGSGESVALFSDERIEGGSSKTSSSGLSAAAGSRVRWTFGAMSLGDRKTFQPIITTVPSSSAPVYQFTYDYDLATANFVISHRWQ